MENDSLDGTACQLKMETAYEQSDDEACQPSSFKRDCLFIILYSLLLSIIIILIAFNQNSVHEAVSIGD